MRIWVDILCPSDVFFFRALINDLRINHQIMVTVRDHAENIALCKDLRIDAKVIGRDYRNRSIKVLNHIFRTIELFSKARNFDISFGFTNSMSVINSKAHFKPSISFDDNEKPFTEATLIGRFDTKIEALANYFIVPSACPFDKILNRSGIYKYDGYKEDVYIADYQPNNKFLDGLPYKRFVVLRPEALYASYVSEVKSIVPQLIKTLIKKDINVVYLPRLKSDLRYLEGIRDSKIFIPKQALNGLDLCWNADVVLTGSGTFAREAACMGTPSVSFFPNKLLAVDQQLVNKHRVFHSRNSDEILEYVISRPRDIKKSVNLEKSKKVKQQVIGIINSILDKCSRE